MSFRSTAGRLLASATPLVMVLVPASTLGASPAPRAHAAGWVLQSRQPWATINICNPKDQPDLLGVRGSMPSDGDPHDTMHLRCRLQDLNSTTKHWSALG